jgi:hypothetical protein
MVRVRAIVQRSLGQHGGEACSLFWHQRQCCVNDELDVLSDRIAAIR